MQESSVYKHLVETAGEEYYQRGARQTAIQSLFRVLEFKFDVGAVQALKPVLETIYDVQLLQQLLDAALQAQSLEAFIRTLNMNSNEQ